MAGNNPNISQELQINISLTQLSFLCLHAKSAGAISIPPDPGGVWREVRVERKAAWLVMARISYCQLLLILWHGAHPRSILGILKGLIKWGILRPQLHFLHGKSTPEGLMALCSGVTVRTWFHCVVQKLQIENYRRGTNWGDREGKGRKGS
jgi:hypothetical protein